MPLIRAKLETSMSRYRVLVGSLGRRRRTFETLEFGVFFLQLFFTFQSGWIARYTIDWANFNTLWCVEMPYAFGASARIDFIVLSAFVNCIIRAFGFAYIAVYALIGY